MNPIEHIMRKEAPMERTIFHIDVNSAFLSWTAVKRLREDPSTIDLRTIPSAVGGDVKTRHGIITARSLPAKRYGIKTAMPVVKALELCPSLILVPSDFETYRAYSAAFIEILHKYAPVVEQLSIDEAFLDMTGTEQSIRSAIFEQIVAGTLTGEKATRLRSLAFPMNAAVLIKEEIRDTLGFTVNVGISTNTLLAKMASDLEKPDKIHTLYPSEIEAKMWPLPIGDLYGCGGKTAEKLRRIGLHTIGDVARIDPAILTGLLGANAGSYIYEAAHGMSKREVSAVQEEAKSISNEITTTIDIDEENLETEGMDIMRTLAEKVAGRLKKHDFYAGTVGFSAKTDDFKRRSVQQKLPDPTQDASKILAVSVTLMHQLLDAPDGLFGQGRKVRLMSIFTANLDHGDYRQMTLEELAENREEIEAEIQVTRKKAEKERKLQALSKTLQDRFGAGTVQRGIKLSTTTDIPSAAGGSHLKGSKASAHETSTKDRTEGEKPHD